jgi:myo-inositol 2-dehydrogenase / D-chiro-inositol 1-dehydrogenase
MISMPSEPPAGQRRPPVRKPTQNPLRATQDRRGFLKTSLVATTLGGLSLARSAHAAGSDVIRIGIVGCGARCPGAAVNAMKVDPGVRLVAMGDVFRDRVESRRAMLKSQKPDQVQVDDAHCFVGLDSYKHVIDSVDVVLIACGGKWHAPYSLAALKAGKHVFVEKPHSNDPVGARDVVAACALAKEQNRGLLSGLYSRFVSGIQETVKRIHDGAIGDVVAIQEMYLRPPYAQVPRDPKLTEMQYQFLNHAHFTWLGGGDVCGSLAHNLDRSTWVMKGQVPIKAHGLGGRSSTFDASCGDLFDHHSIVYEYANGVRLYASCNMQNGCYANYDSVILGTKGRAHLLHGLILGEKKNWKYQGSNPNPYDQEHAALFSSIRAGKPVNCGDYMAASALMCVLGQFACYDGRELTWDQVAKSNLILGPKAEEVRLDMPPPVKPEANGCYAVPVPGVKPLDI